MHLLLCVLDGARADDTTEPVTTRACGFPARRRVRPAGS